MNQNLAFTKANFIILAVGLLIIVMGFILMSGGGSTEQAFNPDIFSDRRIKLAPAVCLAGFIVVVGAILYRPRTK